jgi:hypothetical protein
LNGTGCANILKGAEEPENVQSRTEAEKSTLRRYTAPPFMEEAQSSKEVKEMEKDRRASAGLQEDDRQNH